PFYPRLRFRRRWCDLVEDWRAGRAGAIAGRYLRAQRQLDILLPDRHLCHHQHRAIAAELVVEAVSFKALHARDFAFVDENLEAFAGEVFHKRLGIERLGHHHTAFLDFSGDEQARGERGWDAGLHYGEGVTPFFVSIAMAVHGVDEILDPFAF